GVIGKVNNISLLKRGGEAHSLSYTGWITDDFNISALVGQIKTEYETTPSNITCPRIVDIRDVKTPPILGCGSASSYGANNDDNV
ncbi:hypothetical protein L9G74_21365, partial [Shewanella sp. C32]